MSVRLGSVCSRKLMLQLFGSGGAIVMSGPKSKSICPPATPMKVMGLTVMTPGPQVVDALPGTNVAFRGSSGTHGGGLPLQEGQNETFE